jgi:hypothetical protein
MPDYSKGKIYRITCNITGLNYIGSTCEPTLAKRLVKHVIDFKRWKNGNYCFVTSFKILENGNYEIVLIENYPCNSRDELHSRERHFIETLNCVNKCIPTRTQQEYREENKDKIKQYYENNKDKIREQDKQYYQDNKDKIREKSKQYRDDNKDKIREKEKQYRENNKDKIKERRSKLYHCQCGQIFCIHDKARHERRKYHQDFINNQQSVDSI